MHIVFDACALIAFLNREPGGEMVKELLADTRLVCMAHVINLCEVYYDIMRAADENKAQQTMLGFVEAGIIFRQDIGETFWRKVASYKATLRRVSLADCFALTLANLTQAT